jgi:Domain of unknown function (DUF4062)
MNVYLSSTFVDLEKYRQTVGLALRKAKYDVTMMEEYVARDEVVERACQDDVTKCDVYVGIFAWRYGHVPDDNNPQKKSVTELEYFAAAQRQIPCLVFLLRDDAEWPKESRDADLARISELRTGLKKRCAAYFTDAGSLAVEVLASLRVLESTRFARQIEAIQVIQQGQELGTSYLPNIKKKIDALREAALIEFQIGPIPWWNTRLHLISAWAEEYGQAQEFVFVDADHHFLAVASPTEIRHRLAQRWPDLESAYAAFRVQAANPEAIEQNLWQYPTAVSASFGGDEGSVKEVITARDLEHELGLTQDAEAVDVADKGQAFLQREILGRRTPFVALVRGRKLEGLVDRNELARKVADKALAQLE